MFARTKYIETLTERDEFITRVMSEVAMMVTTTGMPWDPFNIELIVQAQNEPKPQTELCPICGKQHSINVHK